MTNAMNTPRHVSSGIEGEETRLMQPVGYERPVDVKPLDLPKNAFGGYKTEPVEKYVAELKDGLKRERDENLALKRAAYEQDQHKRELNQRITVLSDENKKLRYAAEHPYEKIGTDLQSIVDGANAQRDETLRKAEKDAKSIIGKANEQAAAIIENARKNADSQTNQAMERKRELERQADARVEAARTEADKLKADADSQAAAIIENARGQAARLDEDSKNRMAMAAQREIEANQNVNRARAVLTDALTRIAGADNTPRLPVVNAKSQGD